MSRFPQPYHNQPLNNFLTASYSCIAALKTFKLIFLKWPKIWYGCYFQIRNYFKTSIIIKISVKNTLFKEKLMLHKVSRSGNIPKIAWHWNNELYTWIKWLVCIRKKLQKNCRHKIAVYLVHKMMNDVHWAVLQWWCLKFNFHLQLFPHYSQYTRYYETNILCRID